MWLSELEVVLPEQTLACGSILIVDGRIAEIIEGPARRPDVIAPHLTVMPGLVDLHGDMLEQEVQPRPRAEIPVDVALYELDKRLVGAGITTAYAAISFTWQRNEDDDGLRSEGKARKLIAGVNQLRASLLCDLYVHSRFEITNPDAGDVLVELLNERQVHLVSIMDHTPGQGQYRDVERYVDLLKVWRKRFDGRAATEEEIRAYIAQKQAIPKAWGVVQEVSRIAKEYGVVLASHDDDTAEKVSMVADLGVTVSEFPVTAEAAEAAKNRGMAVAMGAPNAFRGESTSGNLSAFEAVEAGLVDTLATDYHPASMLQAVCKFVAQGVLPLHEAAKLVGQNPAKAAGLPDRGRIEVGKAADLVVFDNRERPRVHATFRQGHPVYWDRFMAELTHLTRRQVDEMG